MGPGLILFRAFAASVLWLSIVGSADAQCQGLFSYRFTVVMNWTELNDEALPEKPVVPAVFAVGHTPDFKLFEVGKQLDNETIDFLRNQKSGAMTNRLNKHKRRGGSIVHFESAKSKGPKDWIGLTVDLDATRNATQVSFIGLLFGTPDSFFGASNLEMCNGTKFYKKFPNTTADPAPLLWAGSFDGGIDDRSNLTQSKITVSKAVSVENRTTLTNGYATFHMEEGRYRHLGNRRRIWIIVGVIVLVALILAAILGLVNFLKKKKAREAKEAAEAKAVLTPMHAT